LQLREVEQQRELLEEGLPCALALEEVGGQEEEQGEPQLQNLHGSGEELRALKEEVPACVRTAGHSFGMVLGST